MNYIFEALQKLLAPILWAASIYPDNKWQLVYDLIFLQMLVTLIFQGLRKVVYCHESLDLCKRLFYVEIIHMFQNYFMVFINFLLFFNVNLNIYIVAAMCLNGLVAMTTSKGVPKTNIVQYIPGFMCNALNIIQIFVLMFIYYLLSFVFYYISYMIIFYYIIPPLNLDEVFCFVCDHKEVWNPLWLALVEFIGTLVIEYVALRKLVRFRYISEVFLGTTLSAILSLSGYPFAFVFLNPIVSTMKHYSCKDYDPMPTILTNWIAPMLGAFVGHLLFVTCFDDSKKTSPDGKGDE